MGHPFCGGCFYAISVSKAGQAPDPAGHPAAGSFGAAVGAVALLYRRAFDRLRDIPLSTLILFTGKTIQFFAVIFAPYFVVVIAGRQPSCFLRLVWHKSASQILLKRFIGE